MVRANICFGHCSLSTDLPVNRSRLNISQSFHKKVQTGFNLHKTFHKVPLNSAQLARSSKSLKTIWIF